MEDNAIAVTVSTYYIDPDKYAVKLLTVIARADSTPVWNVIKNVKTYVKFKSAENYARLIGDKRGVPYIEDVRKGERVTYHQEELLKKYGFCI